MRIIGNRALGLYSIITLSNYRIITLINYMIMLQGPAIGPFFIEMRNEK